MSEGRKLRKFTHQQIERVRVMFTLGASNAQSDGAFGWTGGTANQIANRHNLRPDHRAGEYRHPARIWDVFDGMPDEVVAWFMAQVDGVAPAADVLRGFVVDAYHDEVGK